MQPARSNAPISIQELTWRIKNLLEGHFFNVWVEGELSQLRLHNGNAYLKLTDGQASLSAVVWRSTAARLRYHPEQGERVLAFGRIEVYAKRGDYQLVVQRLAPAGQGVREAELDAVKARLAEDGLFDAARKRALPLFPRAVGVVTSRDGAALRDLIAVIHRRAPQVPIIVSPSQVQGESAARALALALVRVQTRPEVDVVVIGRGGGSRDDLWAFNDERLARVIAECRVPVVSAVGHETDETVADLVADLRAPTPSAAGEAVVLDRVDVQFTLRRLRARLDRGVEGVLRDRRGRCDALGRQVAGALAFEARRLRLERLEARLHAAQTARARAAREALRAASRQLGRHDPSARLARVRRDIAALNERLAIVPRRVAAARGRFQTAVAQLDALSPLACLSRGYSIAEGPSGILRRSDEVAVGEAITVRLHRGRLRATVTDVEEEQT